MSNLIEGQARNLWAELENRQDLLTELVEQEVSPSDIVGFINGCGQMFAAIEQIDSNAIFIPIRGGNAMAWSISEFAAQRGVNLPQFRPLLVGLRRNVDFPMPYTPRRIDKREIIDWDTQLTPEVLGNEVRNPIVIDEKTTGRSSLYVASRVREALEQRFPTYRGPVHLITMEYKDPKLDGYSGIKSGQNGIRPTVIKAKNPFVDNKVFLDTIVFPVLPLSSAGNINSMMHHVHNVEAEELIRILTLSFVKPSALREALLGESETTQTDPDVLRIVDYLKRNLGSDQELRQKIEAWLGEFSQEAFLFDPGFDKITSAPS